MIKIMQCDITDFLIFCIPLAGAHLKVAALEYQTRENSYFISSMCNAIRSLCKLAAIYQLINPKSMNNAKFLHILFWWTVKGVLTL